jgi:hypothetical protein
VADSTVKVVFVGDAKDLKRATDQAQGHLGRFGSAIGSFAKTAALGFGAAAVGLGVFAKGAFDAAMESQKIGKQTEAVIKSTGAAAGVTAKQVSDLAEAISRKTGVDDEAIQSGSNLLLTFTNLQNRVGDGNDIFNQATTLMVDMAAALGTDASGSAIQLGKALNDPIKGITALTRVGVSFTDEQKKQIKAMQEAGDITGAQKIILAELTKEFGGSAAAQATATDRMKVAFGNLQEEIGARLIPAVEAVSTWMVDKGIPLLSRFAAFLQRKLKPVFREIVGGVRAFVAAFKDGGDDITSSGFAGFLERLGVIARNVFDWLKVNVPPVLSAIGSIISNQVAPALRAMGDFLLQKVWPAVKTVFDFLMEHKEILVGIAVAIGVGLVAAFVGWAAAAGAAAVATIAAMAPVIAIGVAIAALVAGVIYAYTHWGWFRTAVDAVASFMRDTLWPILQSIGSWIVDNFVPIIQGAANIFTLGLLPALQAIVGFFRDHVIPAVKSTIEVFGDIGKALWGAFLNVLTVGGKIKSWFEELPGNIKDGFSRLKDYVVAPFAAAFNAIADLWNKTVGSLSFKIPDWAPGIGGKGWDVPDIPKFATGGVVPGPMGAPQLAIVHGGEEVLTAAQRGAESRQVHVHLHIDNSVIAGPDPERWLIDTIASATRRGLVA